LQLPPRYFVDPSVSTVTPLTTKVSVGHAPRSAETLPSNSTGLSGGGVGVGGAGAGGGLGGEGGGGFGGDGGGGFGGDGGAGTGGCGDGEPTPLCTTGTVWPATVTEPSRAGPTFAAIDS
jgi:hypothetical protein